MGIRACLNTNADSVGWISDPNVRGTLSLLISCLTTLALCTYSAIHLNLPKAQESTTAYIWRHLKWTLTGIFGPELVIWAAWRQNVSARNLRQDLSKIQANLPSNHALHRRRSYKGRQSWTLAHCFYAGMGGFVIEPEDYREDDEPQFLPEAVRLTLTPRGIRLLAECDLLPEISAEEILDKSKIDVLGKCLAILQGCWLVVQVITRLIYGLPVTLLEVNTLGHVLCALVVYILWWHKPRDVQDPTRLQGEWVRPLVAFMVMNSNMSEAEQTDRTLLRDFRTAPEVSRLYFKYSSNTRPEIPNPSDTLACSRVGPLDGEFILRPPCSNCQGTEPSADAEKRVVPNLTDATQSTRWQLAATAISSYHPLHSKLTPHASADIEKSRRAMRLYPEMPKRIQRRPSVATTTTKPCETGWLVCQAEQLVTTHASNWPADELLRGFPGIMMGATLWFASIGYGAVHLAAWSAEFATVVEGWFWRSSAIDVALSGVLWAAINIISGLSSTVWWYWYDALEGGISKANYVFIGVLCAIGGFLYVVSRAYLVVEAFVSLRMLPVEAYISPSWVLSVPHL